MNNHILKFRIWSKLSQKMFPTDCITIDKSNTDWEIMQFTGCIDKDNKEIYEGDILKWDKGWMYDEMTGKIQWLDNGYLFRNKKVNWTIPKFTKNAKIIGNIFQNPELL